MTTSENPRVGVYVCHCGGNISDYVDVEEVVRQVSALKDVVSAKRHLFVCSDAGQDIIMEDIKSGLINRVVIASCSPGLHELTFRNALRRAGMNPYLYTHVNIREHVSWVSKGEKATKKAISLIAAGVAKARQLLPLEAIHVDARNHATIIGGGVAGLKAAWDLARQGMNVSLVERSPFLGGFAARLDRLYPTGENAQDFLSRLIGEVLKSERIEVITCAEIAAQEGYIGNFTLDIERRPPEDEVILDRLETARSLSKVGSPDFIPFIGVCPLYPPEEKETMVLNTGAIIVATGFTQYQPHLGEYGFGESPQVITLMDLKQLLGDEKARRDSEGKDFDGYLKVNGRIIKNMVMIHCVGSRQRPDTNEPYEGEDLHRHCSRVCCTGLLSTAVDLRSHFPETEIFDLYRDIRTYGRGHEEIYYRASEAGVRFLIFSARQAPEVNVSAGNGYAMNVSVKELTMGDEDIEIPADLVVLGTGILPGKIKNLMNVMKMQTGPDGFLQEVHPKIRPVEMATAGIYLSGSCQAPMTVNESTSAASAAAAKIAAMLASGVVELEPFVAKVDKNKCSACLTCVRTCPFGVPKIRDGKAYIEGASCYGCGACAGECPGKAIQVEHFSDDHIIASEKALVSGLVA